MKKIYVFFLLLFNLLSAKTIVLASAPFPPFIESENKGIIYEIVKEAFKIEAYDIKVVVLPWNRALETAKQGKYDGLISLFYSQEREDFLVYSDIVFNNEMSYYALANSNIDKEKLDSYKIGVVRGYFYSKMFNSSNKIKKFESVTAEDNLRALINKRVDLILESDKFVSTLVSKSFQNIKNDIVLIAPFSKKPLYIALYKNFSDSDLIIKDFNKGLKEIKKNGTYKKILEKYGY